MREARALALVATAVLVTAVTACGTTSNSTSPSAQGGTASVAAARDNLNKYLTPPTSIVQTEQLKSAPPKKNVAFVQCADQNCAVLAGFVKDATGKLGWHLVTLSATATDPGSAIQQAIDAGVDYIATTGYPLALFKPQLTEAKAKGIPIFECYATDVPSGQGNGLYSDCYDATAADSYARAMADYLTVDSGGKANILEVTIPSYPILNAQTDAARDQLHKHCPGCGFDTLEVTTSDLAGGAVPQQISSYLQAHPDVNYLFFTYNGLSTGVLPALKAAGVANQVKIVGTQGVQAQLTQVANGQSHAWTALSQELAMWTMVDQMARYSVGQWSVAEERKTAVPPFYLVTTPDAAKSIVAQKYGWPGPTGFKDTFTKLWGV